MSKNKDSIKTIIDFGNFKFVQILDQKDKEIELQDKLDSNYDYWNYENLLFSLRNKNDDPVFVLEVDKSNNYAKLNEFKDQKNGPTELASYILDFFNKSKVKFYNNEYSLIESLGYINNIELVPFVKKYFENYKTTKIKNKEYLSLKDKLTLKKSFKSKNNEFFEIFCQYDLSLEAVKLFVESGCNIEESDCFALNLAIENGHTDIVKYLVNSIDWYFSVDQNIRYIKHSFSKAAANGFTDIINFFIDKGMDLENKNHALMMACQSGHLDVVKLLVNSGADIHVSRNFPLKTAKINKHQDIVDFLTKNST